ncbi:MAG: nucleotidyl transferase AbiEii/AbiGii toxin family protein [Bacteroidota bacterium]
MEEYHFNILPRHQKTLWNQLGATPDHFVLYGGTAIALRLGHRESIDFDFFSNSSFNNNQLYRSMGFLDGGRVIQSEQNTLTVLIPGNDEFVKVSFFGNLGLSQLEEPSLMSNGIKMASLLDLFGMKCATVPQRVELKDYMDIYNILNKSNYTLSDGLSAAKAIYGNQYNEIFTLKALSYFENEELRELGQDIKDELIEHVDSVGKIKKINAKNEIGYINEQ